MSQETDALEAYLNNTGVPHLVTSTIGGKHAPNSYHYRGLAVDFAGPHPTVDSPALLAIFAAFVPIESQLAELIYFGAPYQIKHGKHVSPGFYGAATMGIHHNHVHVAVEKGWTFNAPPTTTMKVKPMYSPPLSIVASLEPAGGGVWLLAPDGAVFAFGGAQYKGGANGKAYFAGRKAAALEASGDRYVIVDEAGEKYGPDF